MYQSVSAAILWQTFTHLFIFQAVDDRIDAAIDEHHDYGEVVKNARETQAYTNIE